VGDTHAVHCTVGLPWPVYHSLSADYEEPTSGGVTDLMEALPVPQDLMRSQVPLPAMGGAPQSAVP